MPEEKRDVYSSLTRCSEAAKKEIQMTTKPPVATSAYTLEDYRNAPSGIGPLASEWQDKPHRLLYDLCNRLASNSETVDKMQALDRLRDRAAFLLERDAHSTSTAATVDDEARAREIIVAAWSEIEQTLKQNKSVTGELITEFSLQPFVPLIVAALAQSRADVINIVEAADPYHRSTAPRVGRGYVAGHRHAEDLKSEILTALREQKRKG